MPANNLRFSTKSDLLNTLLEKRGIIGETEADIFLGPDYDRDLHDPFLMRDMEKSCVRIHDAMNNNERIVIYADYDCDGIPGGVILQDLLRKTGYGNFYVYIPGRNSEGYGLNKTAVEQFVGEGVKLLITVDLGITAVEEVALAKKGGIDVIITDHHIPHETLPDAFAILNPKVDDYPEKMLCGAGVAFKLASGFLKKYGEQLQIKKGAEKWWLDMAGLGTLSDMVPLLGENRAIAHFGMRVLRKSPRPGFQKLLSKMNIDQTNLTEDDLCFMVTPRINAASRMDDPMRAFEVLSTTSDADAGALAAHLSKINDDRKVVVMGIMKEVKKKFEDREVREVIVVGNPEWRVGVLGLVAGKICDEHKRPVFVWGKDENGMIKGSCRSEGSASVVELMTEARDSFLGYGGHEMAGGFTVDADKIHTLEDSLVEAFGKVKREKVLDAVLHDIQSNLSIVNMRNWRDIEKMSPFGLANPKPIFFFEQIKIEAIKKFGKNNSQEHLEIVFSDAHGKAKAIAFFTTVDSYKKQLEEGLNVSLLATFDLSHFRGREELRLRIVDIL